MAATTKTAPDFQINHKTTIDYWSSIPSTVNGMLGGYPQISQIDLRGSTAFIAKMRRFLSSSSSSSAKSSSSSSSPLLKRGVDCGAGIGRVTNGLLAKVCEVVDVVEPVERFARVVRESELKRAGKVGDVYVVGLERWDPNSSTTSASTDDSDDNDAGSDSSSPDMDDDEDEHEEYKSKTKIYDLIWNQWCVGYLTDEQFVDLLRRCRRFLSPTGLIVVKENVSTDPNGEDIFDDEDSSVIRTDAKYKAIFVEAGLNLIRSEEQLGFPKSLGLFPVRFYALRPAPITTTGVTS